MKSILSFVCLIWISTATFAKPAFSITAFGNHLFIQTTDKTLSDLNVTILDEVGHVLIEKQFNTLQPSQIMKFNIAKLEDGMYTVAISDNVKSQKQNFEMVKKQLVLKAEYDMFFKPHVLVSGKTLKVNYLNLDNVSTLKILDPANHVIYETTIDKPQFGKIFNLSNLSPGEYVLNVEQAAHSYTYNIKLQ